MLRWWLRFVVLTVMLSVGRAFRSTSRMPVTRSWQVRNAVSTTTSGTPHTTDFRIHFREDGGVISPWHDIPLRCGENFNFISEVPKFTKAKMEVATKEAGNPIAQDIKKGKLRDYHGPMYWNYGCFPQTWEDPSVEHPEVRCKGDNDPLDVVEIGEQPLPTGTVTAVKVLGVLAMIDDGELDWKVISIRASDPLAARLNDVADVDKVLPGTLSGIREWFRWYKTPDMKPLNAFGYNEQALPRSKALQVIAETHHHWELLRSGKSSPGKLWIGK